jgi:hypothetical protein
MKKGKTTMMWPFLFPIMSEENTFYFCKPTFFVNYSQRSFPLKRKQKKSNKHLLHLTDFFLGYSEN